MPMLRRKNGTEAPVSRPTSRPKNKILPESTDSAAYSRRSSVLFPAPEGPVTNTNSPRAMLRLSPLSTGASMR
jgi:hypothetical protein